MRIRFAITLTVGDKPAPDGDRYEDGVGTHHEARPTDRYLGFTIPANDGATEGETA